MGQRILKGHLIGIPATPLSGAESHPEPPPRNEPASWHPLAISFDLYDYPAPTTPNT